MAWIRSHKAIAALGVVVGVGVVAWLAFGLFGVHTLFLDDQVDEAGPVFESGATSPTTGTSERPAPTDSTTSGTSGITAPVVRTVAGGSFVDRSHPADGRVVALTDGAQTFLRFEDFQTDNGPDLFVYVSRGVTADSPEGSLDDGFVNLGTLKGNVGDQNYEVPSDVDLGQYSTVVIWCRQFSVAFGAADLMPAAS